jgi:alpha/beta superfamily hydrolase
LAEEATVRTERIRFPSAGEYPVPLEGELQWLARADMPLRRAGVVVCHPDPRYGGTMDNRVVRSLADQLVGAGMAVLRFNFRGVGESQGEFGGGLPEVSDCLGAITWLGRHETVDATRVGVVGYSFGAVVGLHALVQAKSAAKAFVGVGFPLTAAEKSLSPYGFVREAKRPLLFASGDADDMSSLDSIRRLTALTGVEAEFCAVAGADHLFSDDASLGALDALVSSFMRAHLSAGASSGAQGQDGHH